MDLQVKEALEAAATVKVVAEHRLYPYGRRAGPKAVRLTHARIVAFLRNVPDEMTLLEVLNELECGDPTLED